MNNAEKTLNDKKLTYLDMQTIYLDKLASESVSKQQIKNNRSAIGFWCKDLHLEAENEIGEELNQLFSQTLTKFIVQQIKSNIKKSTYSSRVSMIKKFRRFYLNHKELSFLPESFGDRLKFFLDKSGLSAVKFVALKLNGEVDYTSFLSWVAGRAVPKPASDNSVKLIEKILSLSLGTLTSALPYRKNTSPQVGEFQKRMRLIANRSHRILTEELKREFDEFTDYKLTVTLPEKMERLSAWTRNQSGETPSAKLCLRYVTDFAGFLCCSPTNPDPKFRGRGFSKDQLTLALLTEKDLVEEYVTVFRKNRSGGKYNGYHITVLSFITSILRERTGYLYQKPEFAEKLGVKLTIEQWQAKCIDTRNRLLKIKKSIEQAKKNGGGDYCLGRDPEQPIRDILDLSDPLSETLKMTEKMLSDVEKLYSEPLKQARLYRDTLLIAMLQANPLRAYMMQHMKIDENLVKKPDGSWWIEFKRNDFKNRKSLKDHYSIQLSPHIWPMIERYLTEFRPRFERHASTKIVFVNSKPLPKDDQVSSPFVSVWAKVFNATKKYIPGCTGFGPHALRHIVAASLVNSNTVTGIYLAAYVLNDDPKTVKEHYAHLQTNAKFALYNDFFADNWLKAGLSTVKG